MCRDDCRIPLTSTSVVEHCYDKLHGTDTLILYHLFPSDI